MKDKIATMTIKEKVQQMFQTSAVFISEDTIADNTGLVTKLNMDISAIKATSSVLNFDGAIQMRELSDYILNNSTHKIPPIFMQDVIHGYKIIFPIPLALACSFDEQLVTDCCRMAAQESVLNGVQVTFSPMVDLVRDARWGRVMESSGEDPLLNGIMGRAQIRGYHQGGLLTCVKHFACYGACESGKDYNTTDMSDYVLNEYYLKPYKECLKENPDMVMTSFNALNGRPVNANKSLLVDKLRNEWGFDGVVISDYNGIVEMIAHGFAQNEKQCAQICANNQIDMEMVSCSYTKNLPQLVEEGAVSMDIIDKSVERILTLKQKAGLFGNRYGCSDDTKAKAFYANPQNRELARIAAEKSTVLLKNDGILPLSTQSNVVLAGPMATQQDIIGAWHCFGDIADAISVKTGFEGYLDRVLPVLDKNDYDVVQDVVVVCLGETSVESGESCSKAHLEIPEQQVELVRKLYEKNKKIVAIVFAGRPLVLSPIEPYCNAILYAWQPGLEGGNALANIVFGSVNPSASVTMSFPRATGQCPIYYNGFKTGRPKIDDSRVEYQSYLSCYVDEYNTPLYPFGYGLSYSQFEVSNVKISQNTIAQNETIVVSAVVKNCGKFDGEKVIQMYVHDKFGSCVRPVKELKAFSRVHLYSMQSKTIYFDLSEEMLRYYNDGVFESEIGDFEVFVGLDSACTDSVTLRRI